MADEKYPHVTTVGELIKDLKGYNPSDEVHYATESGTDFITLSVYKHNGQVWIDIGTPEDDIGKEAL